MVLIDLLRLRRMGSLRKDDEPVGGAAGGMARRQDEPLVAKHPRVPGPHHSGPRDEVPRLAEPDEMTAAEAGQVQERSAARGAVTGDRDGVGVSVVHHRPKLERRRGRHVEREPGDHEPLGRRSSRAGECQPCCESRYSAME